MRSIIQPSKKLYFFALMLAAAYIYGILSTQHYLPSVLDLYISLGVTLILGIGLLVYVSTIKIKYSNSIAVLCLFFASLILLQPIINNIDYSDSLIFPVISLLFMGLISIVLVNIEEKSIIIYAILASVYIGGILTVCTQLLQLEFLSYPSWLSNLTFHGTDNTRPYGNVGQPNQAAYIITMSMLASGYWLLKLKHNNAIYNYLLIIIFFISILFLGIGQGLSSSRGGLILSIIACLGISSLFDMTLRKRSLFLAVLLAVLSMGNWLGVKLLGKYANFQFTAIDRVIATDASRPLRWYLQEQAWSIFSSNWLTGAGWGNFPKMALPQAESLNWFVFATNSHFLPSQIAAELGILGVFGLVALLLIVLRSIFSAKCNLENKAIITLLIISLLYACSEYPFWYIRFLFLFTCLLSLIDTRKILVNFNLKPFFITFLFTLLLGSGYYLNNYRMYVAVDSLIKRPEVDSHEAEVLVAQLPNIYGFNKFKEVMLFQVVSVNEKNIKYSIELGNRVVNNYLDPDLMVKQAMLLALNNDQEDSLRLFKAACLYDFSKNCKLIEKKLSLLSITQPLVFKDINESFKTWRLNIK